MDLPEIEPFEGKLDDVNIYIHDIKMIAFEEEEKPENKYTALTDVHHYRMAKHLVNNGNGRELVGNLVIIYRNQGEHFPSIIMLNCTVSASSEFDNDGASVFCKLIQYLMDWSNEYVKTNQIKDMTGENDFIMPPFFYSRDQFPSFAG